ncbi:MAG: hypothetical protein WBF93_18145 [Pirellulales bacterium]
MTLKRNLVLSICLLMIASLAPMPWAEASLADIELSFAIDEEQADEIPIVRPRLQPPQDGFVWLDLKDAPEFEPRLTVDNSDTAYVTKIGEWTGSVLLHGFYFNDYLRHTNAADEAGSVTFSPQLPHEGMYEVYMRWPADDLLSDKVPVDIQYRGGTVTVLVNQQRDGDQWNLLGRFYFAGGSFGCVTIRAGKTDGMVVADAVQFRPDNTLLATLLQRAQQGPHSEPTVKDDDPSVTIRPTGFGMTSRDGTPYAGYGRGDIGWGYGRREYYGDHGRGNGFGNGNGFGGSSTRLARRDYSVFTDPDCEIPGLHLGDCELEDGDPNISPNGATSLTSTLLASNSFDPLALFPTSDMLLETVESFGSTAVALPSATALAAGAQRLLLAASALQISSLQPSGSLALAGVANPEPSTGILLVLGAFLTAVYSGRPRRRR